MYYGYCRKSTDRQNETSFEVQDMFLRSQAERLGENYTSLTETGSGGTFADRPVFMRLMSNLKEGDIVGCYDQSRISRNDKESFIILDMIIAKKARLHVNGKYIDPDDPQDRAIYGMQSIFANYQKDIQLKKSKEGVRKKYENGDAVFAGDTFGYEVIKKGKAVQINIIKEEARIIKHVFEKYAEGENLHELERQLNGTPTTRPFNFEINNLRYMIQRPLYMGYYLTVPNMQRHIMKYSEDDVRKALVKSNLYPPIVDEELWWRCFRSYRDCKRPHAIAHCYRWIKAELSGIYKCADCKGGMTFHNRFRSEIGEHGSYYPQYKFYKHTLDCPTKKYTGYRADWLEELNKIMFWLTFLEGGEIGLFFAEKKNELYESTKELNNAVEQLDSSIKEIDKKISRLVDAIADGVLDNNSAGPKMEKLKAEKKTLTDKRTTLMEDLAGQLGDADTWLENTADEILNTFDNDRRGHYLRYVKEGLNYHTHMTLEYLNGKFFEIQRPKRTNFKVKPAEIKVSFRGRWQYTFIFDWDTRCCVLKEVNSVEETREYVERDYRAILEKAVSSSQTR